MGACVQDKEIGEITVPNPGYTLPQGKSPADSRIVELYNKYGSYFLYEFSRQDFIWTFVANSTIPPYQCTPADPAYVGPFLDLLEDIWFQFYTDDFLATYLPYRVFLTGTIVWTAMGNSLQYARQADNQIALAYCSDTLLTMSRETKVAYKIALQRQFWANSYVNLLEFPEEFYAVTDYTRDMNNTDPLSPDYFKTRGFFVNANALNRTPARDLYNFFWTVLSGTYAVIENDLDTYPLLKQKFNIIRDFLIQRYGVDIRKIMDETYE